MRSAWPHICVSALAVLSAIAGCVTCGDLLSQAAMVAGAFAVVIVLADLYRHPYRPEEPGKKLSP